MFQTPPTAAHYYKSCNDCSKFLVEIEKFVEKSNLVQKMFFELDQIPKSDLNLEKLDEVRLKFGFLEVYLSGADFTCEILNESPVKQEKQEVLDIFKCEYFLL